MLPTRRIRWVASVVLALVVLTSATLRADTDKLKWDPARITSPETVEELKSLQEQVKQVVAKVSDSTIAVLVGPGAGSGVIVSEDGLVLTAAHVIGKPGQTARFVLSDGTIVRGKTLGSNDKVDSGMAIITDKPPKSATWPGAAEGKWPKLDIGEGTTLKKGQWVISLGHPGGPKRERPPPVRVGRFDTYNRRDTSIRTDCTLVGGDSGGPLFDLTGKVVGIHSRIGVFLEYNIHIPSEAFKTDWERMARGDLVGKPTTVELGMTIDTEAERPTVASVAEKGPAEKAGFLEGDILLRINDVRVLSTDDLTQMLSAYEPNQTIEVMIDRKGKPMTLKLTLARKGRK